MMVMQRYVVMHDYGSEGWKVVGQYDTILDAVYARDDDMRNGGGDVAIFEWLHPLDAYDRANTERAREKRGA